MEITGIPESVPFSAVQDFLRSLGIDLNQVAVPSKDDDFTPGIVIGRNTITCPVFATRDGMRLIEPATGRVALHHICIRIDPMLGEQSTGEK